MFVFEHPGLLTVVYAGHICCSLTLHCSPMNPSIHPPQHTHNKHTPPLALPQWPHLHNLVLEWCLRATGDCQIKNIGGVGGDQTLNHVEARKSGLRVMMRSRWYGPDTRSRWRSEVSRLVGQDDCVSLRLHPCVCFSLSVFLGTLATHAFTHAFTQNRHFLGWGLMHNGMFWEI